MSGNIRIIPRLDVKGPNLIKGLQFEGYRVLGLAAQFAEHYSNAGADEILYQDVMASLVRREPNWNIISEIARNIRVPLTVAGGLRSLSDINRALECGADKIGINTAGIADARFFEQAAREFGSQCIVAMVDSFSYNGTHCVWTNYGREATTIDVLSWVRQLEARGVGEIVLSSIEADGLGEGFNTKLIRAVCAKTKIPVIAACGAGTSDHVLECASTGVSGIGIASMLHYNLVKPIPTVTMNWNDNMLRRGALVDSGNIEFIRDGYGADRSLFVQPQSIATLKRFLSANKVQTRIVEDRQAA